MLHTMYYADEVRKVEGFGAPDVDLKEAEVKVAHQLIEALADEWDPDKYKDNFQENLKKLIETKLEGGEVAAVEKPKKLAPVVDLMAALKQSLAQMEGKKKPAARAKDEEPVAAAAERKITPPSIMDMVLSSCLAALEWTAQGAVPTWFLPPQASLHRSPSISR